jgi:hypothetical protein
VTTAATEPASRPLGRSRTRAALTAALPRDEAGLAFALVDLFGHELDAYAELISGPGERVTGFMTRGEGAPFAERVRVVFAELGLGAAAYERFAALSSWFAHRRGFLKIEWHRGDAGSEPLVACYFRRRPAVADALVRLGELGLGPRSLARVRTVSEMLDKATIHFVSAAFRPGRPAHHKLYFSQMADADGRPAAAVRLERVFDLFEIAGPGRERWRELHETMLGGGAPTWFVSTSCAGDEPSADFKIDYPEVAAAGAVLWRPAEERADRAAEIERLCSRAGTQALSFLGVRFFPGDAAPAIKYYADVPRGEP